MERTVESLRTESDDPNVRIGKDTFIFLNGDKYEGEFKATKDRKIWREGFGIYLSGDGHIYKNNWINDCIDGNLSVEFSDGSSYSGEVQDMEYTGIGQYTFDDGSYITGTFAGNCPQGLVKLIDNNCMTWLGYARLDGVCLMQQVPFVMEEQEDDDDDEDELFNSNSQIKCNDILNDTCILEESESLIM